MGLEPAACLLLVGFVFGAEKVGESAFFGEDLEAGHVENKGGKYEEGEAVGEPDGECEEGESECGVHGVAGNGVDSGSDEGGGVVGSDGVDGGLGADEGADCAEADDGGWDEAEDGEANAEGGGDREGRGDEAGGEHEEGGDDDEEDGRDF